MNSSAEALMEFKSAKSNCKKMASLPVFSRSSFMAYLAFSSLRAAMYTFALCKSNACILSKSLTSLVLMKTCLCRFLSNPYGSSSVLIFVRSSWEHTCICTSNDHDFSRQVRNVLYIELALGRENLADNTPHGLWVLEKEKDRTCKNGTLGVTALIKAALWQLIVYIAYTWLMSVGGPQSVT